MPEGQCSLTTHCTQVWLTVSQRFCGAAPPSVGPPLGAQPSSLRQPGSQVLVAPLQCSVAGQVSLLATHCTHRPEVVSQAPRPGLLMQSAALMQRGGPMSAGVSIPTSIGASTGASGAVSIGAPRSTGTSTGTSGVTSAARSLATAASAGPPTTLRPSVQPASVAA